MIFLLGTRRLKRPLKYRVCPCTDIIVTLMIPTDSSMLLSLLFSCQRSSNNSRNTLEKLLRMNSIFNKVVGSRPATSLKNKFFHRCLSRPPLKLSVTSYSHLSNLSKNLAKNLIILLFRQ